LCAGKRKKTRNREEVSGPSIAPGDGGEPSRRSRRDSIQKKDREEVLGEKEKKTLP